MMRWEAFRQCFIGKKKDGLHEPFADGLRCASATPSLHYAHQQNHKLKKNVYF